MGYDQCSNLVSFQDGDGNVTGYALDSLNRLTTITYPDSTTELFGYDPGSRLTSYTDNSGRERILQYDLANRLSLITYSDSTTLQLNYDPVGNVCKIVERNGDWLILVHDALNRLVKRFLSGTTTPEWLQDNTFDANSNRTALLAEPPAIEAVYGTALYGTDVYVGPTVFWQVASPGYNSHNLPPGFLDRNSNLVSFLYDIEDRRTQVKYPFPAESPVQTTATFDLMGRLLALATVTGSTTLMSLEYSYDLSSSRVSQITATDTFEYGLDGATQLVEALLNRFVEDRTAHFQEGTFDRVMIDPSTPSVQLLSFNDSFSGNLFDADRWRIFFWQNNYVYNPPDDFVGVELRQNDGLCMTFPKGYSDVRYADYRNTMDNFGYAQSSQLQAVAEHRQILQGDFTVQVDFAEFNASGTFSLAALNIQTASWPTYSESDFQAYIGLQYDNIYGVKYYGAIANDAPWSEATTATSGTVSIVRTGDTISLYYGSTLLGSGTNSAYTADVYVSFILNVNEYCNIRWNNLQATVTNYPIAPYPSATPVTPSYTSAVYDSGQTETVTWNKLNFTADVPTGTTLQFQVATSVSETGPFTYVGPDGTDGTYFTSPGALASGTVGRYASYKAWLTADSTGTLTPSFSAVSLSFSQEGSNESTQWSYGIDAAQNILSVTTTTDAGVGTDVRTVNALNQVTTNAVTPVGGPTTTYTHTWNLDGTLASKTDGTNTWVYNWSTDGDQRLMSVVLNGTTLVAYTWDRGGRMLTRTVSGVTTTFEWDGFTCIRETTSGAQTRYYAPWGELLTFERGGVTYQVVSDALGCVRVVTDDTGTVVARLDFDPWGNLLNTSFDSVPGGMPYRFVGALGCRWDSATGLIYMRQRWYDPAGLQRFISRDRKRSANRYVYCFNSSINFVDPSGIDPTWTPTITYVSGTQQGTALSSQGQVQFSGSSLVQAGSTWGAAGYSFVSQQGSDRYGVLNAMMDSTVVYVSAHGNLDPGHDNQGYLDLGSGAAYKLTAWDLNNYFAQFGPDPLSVNVFLAGSNASFANAIGAENGSTNGRAFVGFDKEVGSISAIIMQYILGHLAQGMNIQDAIAGARADAATANAAAVFPGSVLTKQVLDAANNHLVLIGDPNASAAPY